MIKNLVDGCKIVSKGFINTYLEEKEAWKNNKNRPFYRGGSISQSVEIRARIEKAGNAFFNMEKLDKTRKGI